VGCPRDVRAKNQFSDDAACGDDAQDGIRKVHVAYPDRGSMQTARLIDITNCHRAQVCIAGAGGLEQCGFEWVEGRAVARGGLGKQGDVIPGA